MAARGVACLSDPAQVQRPNILKFSIPNQTEEDRSKVLYFGFFSKEEIKANAGRLLMLDIDFGRACSLSCPTCFRRNNVVDDTDAPDLTFDELMEVVSQARGLGLREIKICGAGEPLENPDLLRLARQLTDWNIGLSIFTKGHVLGDDALAASVFSHEGIKNASHLAQMLFELKTSMLVSFQSFRPDIQDRLVGGVQGHTQRRNRAVELLASVGFNKCNPTRLMFCALPVTRATYDHIFDIYVYCRERNILPLVTSFMVSGKQFTDGYLAHVDVTDDDKLRLYQRIYRYNFQHGIQSADGIKEDGISPMPGIHPCNQIAAGLYITCNGNVLSCPGATTVLGNPRERQIADIWHDSPNFLRRGIFNCKCPPKDGGTVPLAVYKIAPMELM